MKAWMLDDWELVALAALVAAIVIARKRRVTDVLDVAEEMRRLRYYLRRCRHPVPGLDVDGEPLTRDEWAALDRIEVATLISQGLTYDDGTDLP